MMGLLAAVRSNNSHYATPRVTQFALYALCQPPMATLLAHLRPALGISAPTNRSWLFGRAFLIIYLLRDVTYILDPSTPTISPITLMSLAVRFRGGCTATMAIPQTWCGCSRSRRSLMPFAPMHVTDLIGTEACGAATRCGSARARHFCAIVFGFSSGCSSSCAPRAPHRAPGVAATAADDGAESKLGMHPSAALRLRRGEGAFAIGLDRSYRALCLSCTSGSARRTSSTPGNRRRHHDRRRRHHFYHARVARAARRRRARARALASLVTFGTAVPCSLIVALRAAGVVAVIGLRAGLGPSSATSGCTTATRCSLFVHFLIVAVPAGLRFEQRIVYVVAVTVTAAFDAVGGETPGNALRRDAVWAHARPPVGTTRRLQHVLLRQQDSTCTRSTRWRRPNHERRATRRRSRRVTSRSCCWRRRRARASDGARRPPPQPRDQGLGRRRAHVGRDRRAAAGGGPPPPTEAQLASVRASRRVYAIRRGCRATVLQPQLGGGIVYHRRHRRRHHRHARGRHRRQGRDRARRRRREGAEHRRQGARRRAGRGGVERPQVWRLPRCRSPSWPSGCRRAAASAASRC